MPVGEPPRRLPSAQDAGDERSLVERPYAAHVLLAVGGVLVLYAASTPGGVILGWIGAGATLLAAALLWFVWIASLGRRGRAWLWLPVAPLAACLVAVLVMADIPLKARWSASRSAFAAQVEALPVGAEATDEWVPLVVPERLGLFDLTMAYRVPRGVVFYEANGALSDDAGFAYLPEGPSAALENGSFESPQFRHLGGPWYAWTASW